MAITAPSQEASEAAGLKSLALPHGWASALVRKRVSFSFPDGRFLAKTRDDARNDQVRAHAFCASFCVSGGRFSGERAAIMAAVTVYHVGDGWRAIGSDDV